MTIAASHLQAGPLPDVCIKTGAATRHGIKLRLVTHTRPLLLLGLAACLGWICQLLLSLLVLWLFGGSLFGGGRLGRSLGWLLSWDWLFSLPLIGLIVPAIYLFTVIMTIRGKTVRARIPLKRGTVYRLKILRLGILGSWLLSMLSTLIPVLWIWAATLPPGDPLGLFFVTAGIFMLSVLGLGLGTILTLLFKAAVPRAVIHRPPGSADSQVVIRGVHPNFAHALAAMQAPPAAPDHRPDR